METDLFIIIEIVLIVLINKYEKSILDYGSCHRSKHIQLL